MHRNLSTKVMLSAAVTATVMVAGMADAQVRQGPRIIGNGPTGEAAGVGTRPTATPTAPASAPTATPPTTPAGATPATPATGAPAVTPPPVDSAAARTLVRLERMEAELRAMTDRVERLEAETRRLREDNARLSAASTTPSPSTLAATSPETPAANQVAAATAPTTGPTTPPVTAPTPSAATPTPAAPAAATATAATPTATSPATTEARVATLPAGASAMSVLREARMSIQTRDYPAAERGLAALVETWPDAPEADEGRWLLGETRFVQQAWAPAAEAYVAYLSKSPEGRRVPEVYIRLAGVFRNVGDNAQRCRALNAFTESFPEAGPVMMARYTQEAALGPPCAS